MNINDLRAKLDNAISNFKNSKDQRSDSFNKETHDYHLYINKMFNKMHQNIVYNLGNQNANLHKILLYRNSINISFDKMRRNLCENQNKNSIYKKIIDKQMKLFKLNIYVKENMIENKQNGLKMNGLDPKLYQYYSSSDDKSFTSAKSSEIGETESFNEELNKKIQEHAKIHENKIQNEIERKHKDDLTNLKDEIENDERNQRNIILSKHESKDKIHVLFKKLALNKLQLTEKLLEKSKTDIHDKMNNEFDRKISDVNVNLQNKTQEIQNVNSQLQTEKLVHQKDPELYEHKSHIMRHFLNFEKCIMKTKETMMDNILSELQFILQQGCLEDDMRFLEKLSKQIVDIEKFDTPRFFKIGVHMEIAKKFVSDVIHLKKKALVQKYYNLK